MKNVDNERDRSIERLLRDALQSRAAAPGSECVDAETAAAWADGALAPRERARAEAHAADCARCQTLLAALAKTSPPAPAHSWFRLSTIGWLAPLTGVAAGVLVWTIVAPRARYAPAQRAPASVDAVAPAPAPPLATPPAQSKLEAVPADRKAVRGAPQKKNVPLTEARAEQEKEKKDERDRFRKTVAARAREKAFADAGIGGAAGGVASPAPLPAVPPPAPPPSPAQPVADKDKVAPSAPATASDQVAARNAAPPPATMAGARILEPRAAAEGLLAKRADAQRQQSVIVSANPSHRWLIAADGVVMHTTDGGSTWETQRTGVASTLTAGASPSPQVCWLVGPRGIVVVSTDGRSWQAVAFPEKIDLVAVRATDDKTATVTAVDGRTFSTTDRGAAWKPARPR